MQFAPDAADLLAAVARLLDQQVLGAVPGELQHPVRVAAHLVSLVERELRLGPEATARERQLLVDLLGTSSADPVGELAERLRRGDDPELEEQAWPVLMEITRLDLAIAKPGHDSWTGE